MRVNVHMMSQEENHGSGYSHLKVKHCRYQLTKKSRKGYKDVCDWIWMQEYQATVIPPSIKRSWPVI